MSIELFYSYAHEDEQLRHELEKHLSLLRRQGFITAWHDRDISAGKEWEHEIDSHLNTARIILLLVSPDFMASDYCYDTEVKRAMERHQTGEALVIPIILRPVDWQGALFGKLQALPADGKAASLWPNGDAAFYDIARGIREAIDDLTQPPVSQVHPIQASSDHQKEAQAMPPQHDRVTDEASMNELQRPATALLSYAHEDMEEVKSLQLQLKLRGVRAWRDVTDLASGSVLRDEIVHAIEQEADAFVLYVTPHCLNSRFIWDTEVPTALKRRERDPLFSIIPIMRGVTFSELQHQCAARGYRSLADFKAEPLPDSITIDTQKEFHTKLMAIAARALKATLALRFRRIKADRNYEPWIRFCTFDNRPSTPSLDLDLDWWDLFRDRERLPPVEEWRDFLFPALLDVKSALGEKHANHALHIAMKAILPAAFALGYIFPAPSSFILLPESNKGPWSTSGTPAASSSLRRTEYNESGDRQVAVVEIALSNPTANATAEFLSNSRLSYGYHIRYELPDGPDPHDGVTDAAHALAIVRYIGKELRTIRGQGVTHIHLFAAVPVALAIMLGHQFNALCSISLYQFVNNKEYLLACMLDPSV